MTTGNDLKIANSQNLKFLKLCFSLRKQLTIAILKRLFIETSNFKM